MRRLDVDEMLDELTCEEFDDWMVYGLVEPWGGTRDDERFGTLVAWMVKAFTGATVKPEDVFPTLRTTEPREQTPEEMKFRAMLSMAAANRGRK